MLNTAEHENADATSEAAVPRDGLAALRAEIGLREIASLIERTARWVAPETFKLLPVWYPEHARKLPNGEMIVQTPHLVGSFAGRSPVLLGLKAR